MTSVIADESTRPTKPTTSNMEKRNMVEEIEAPNTPDQKRRKLTQNQLSPTAEKGSTKVGATELASAFALASLATVVSPGSTKSIEPTGRLSLEVHERDFWGAPQLGLHRNAGGDPIKGTVKTV